MTPEMRNAHLATLVIGPGTGAAGGGGGAGGFPPGGMARAAGDREAIVPLSPRVSAAGGDVNVLVPSLTPAAAAPPAPAAPVAADAAQAPAATPAPAPAAPAAAATPERPADPAAGERARIAGILAAPEASGREALARHLALNTALDATTARAILAASPVAAPAAQGAPAPRQSLDQRMAGVETPPVGISGAPAVSDPDAAAASFILSAARRARGENS